MKKIILAAVFAAMLTGCAAHDVHYAKAKQTYLTGKAVAEVVPMDTNTSESLGVIDWVVVEYDTIRSWVRDDEK